MWDYIWTLNVNVVCQYSSIHTTNSCDWINKKEVFIHLYLLCTVDQSHWMFPKDVLHQKFAHTHMNCKHSCTWRKAAIIWSTTRLRSVVDMCRGNKPIFLTEMLWNLVVVAGKIIFPVLWYIAFYRWIIKQKVVVFLQSFIDDDVYIVQPQISKFTRWLHGSMDPNNTNNAYHHLCLFVLCCFFFFGSCFSPWIKIFQLKNKQRVRKKYLNMKLC